MHVNPRLRKLKFESYAVIAPLPIEFPRLKNALVKWAWKQTPDRGWCPLPPSIALRTDPESKYEMVKACKGIEESMIQSSKFASAVAGKANERPTIKWIGEVDIALVSFLLEVPKNDPDGKRMSEQAADLSTKCAEFVALKSMNP